MARIGVLIGMGILEGNGGVVTSRFRERDVVTEVLDALPELWTITSRLLRQSCPTEQVRMSTRPTATVQPA
jgi:hypothetical protein